MWIFSPCCSPRSACSAVKFNLPTPLWSKWPSFRPSWLILKCFLYMPMLPTRSAKEPRQSYQRWTKKMEPLIPTSSQSMSLQLGYNHQWQDVNKDCCKVLKISHTTSRVTKVAHDYLNSFAMLGHKGSWCSGCNRLSVVPTPLFSTRAFTLRTCWDPHRDTFGSV